MDADTPMTDVLSGKVITRGTGIRKSFTITNGKVW